MKTILFQGDSITDCLRDKEDTREFGITHLSTVMGRGYAYMASAQLGMEYPGRYRFLNRGVNGSRLVDMFSRMKSDIINLKPDYLSILIGVNDIWHEVASQNGTSAELYGKIYSLLLDEVRAALPDIKIILMSPFVLKGPDTENTEQMPDKWEIFRTEVDKRIEVVNRLGEKYSLPVIPLQKLFDEACEKSGSSVYWASDGVHPTPFGHRLIADAWTAQFKML